MFTSDSGQDPFHHDENPSCLREIKSTRQGDLTSSRQH
jgi:hypothetical protein